MIQLSLFIGILIGIAFTLLYKRFNYSNNQQPNKSIPIDNWIEHKTIRSKGRNNSTKLTQSTTIQTKSSKLRKPSSTCPYTFKLFIYPFEQLLPSFQLAEQARKNQTYHICHKCIYEQFSLEYIIYDYFSQFCGRTMNPDEADFFYIPMLRYVQ